MLDGMYSPRLSSVHGAGLWLGKESDSSWGSVTHLATSYKTTFYAFFSQTSYTLCNPIKRFCKNSHCPNKLFVTSRPDQLVYKNLT